MQTQEIREFAAKLSTAAVLGVEATIKPAQLRTWAKAMEAAANIIDRSDVVKAESHIHRLRKMDIWEVGLGRTCFAIWILYGLSELTWLLMYGV